ncbi:MAG: methylmalonyl Co-A mutase-associated GTPase MeaB [Chloroflexaceae bacterium]|nr:methylmalonyl Co-A mutase-associated GTPase MeaB [Chloroflexaceae bacterium]NJL33313.1 methylmalonyl Co-A mutase-associated GTPase MeaB [Chloroflexaceae bacterium]
MTDRPYKPEWVPENGGNEYAAHVMPGVSDASQPTRRPTYRRRRLTVDEYVQGVLENNLTVLAQTITLIESNAPAHLDVAQEVLRQLLPYTGKSMRVGITGVPGVGKSTFIEALGMMLCERGHRLAVLAVDPSSSVTGGSILGDKTRMELLSRHPNAFIRPSPSSGTLGGVARKSRETMLVCEAAGFDVVLIETIGVGQSEITVRSMVDFFLLLMLAGAGDELQGIKKGVIEIADALLVNKADGDNKLKAKAARAEYARALHFLSSATEGWKTGAYTCSATTGAGIVEIWEVVEHFQQQTTASGVFGKRRQAQMLHWMQAMIDEQLRSYFLNHPRVTEMRPQIEQAVRQGEMPATLAAQILLRAFEGER